MQVIDGGVVDALERCRKAALVAHVDSQCMAVTVEGAAEWLVIIFVLEFARHRRHADVAGQLDELAAV